MKKSIKNTDFIILILALILTIIGIVGIYSAGINSTSSSTEYIKQIIWAAVALVVMSIAWLLDSKLFGIVGIITYPVFLILLTIVLFTTSVNGASSWFNIGSVQIQPSEFMKIAYILLLAKYIDFIQSKSKDSINKLYYLFGALCIFLLPVLLIVLQPDFGTALVFVSITFFMLFRSGISYKYVVGLIFIILLLAPLFYFFVLSDYQQQRIQVFLNPELEPLGAGYNAIQSKIAVGSGMFLGLGLGNGTQTQWGYLPVKSSDFIFAVLSEEFGFIMSVLIVIIYIILFFRILKLAQTAINRFDTLVCMGIFGMFFFHFIENIGMTIGLMPITGIPLPFVSYGGSSMLTNYIALGILLSISSSRQKSLFVE